MSCGVGRPLSSDLVLLWLWHRPEATAPIQSLAWEPPYAVGAAPEKKKDKKKERNITNNIRNENGNITTDPEDIL